MRAARATPPLPSSRRSRVAPPGCSPRRKRDSNNGKAANITKGWESRTQRSDEQQGPRGAPTTDNASCITRIKRPCPSPSPNPVYVQWAWESPIFLNLPPAPVDVLTTLFLDARLRLGRADMCRQWQALLHTFVGVRLCVDETRKCVRRAPPAVRSPTSPPVSRAREREAEQEGAPSRSCSPSIHEGTPFLSPPASVDMLINPPSFGTLTHFCVRTGHADTCSRQCQVSPFAAPDYTQTRHNPQPHHERGAAKRCASPPPVIEIDMSRF